MRRVLSLQLGLVLLAALLAAWLVLYPYDALPQIGAAALLPAVALYSASHLCRLLRLAMLSLDQRARVPALMLAHGLTAFPASLLPFKIGEIVRLGAFMRVYADRRKAFAVWLAERCADVLVLSLLMLAVSLFDVRLPGQARTVFLLFLMVSVFGLLGLFAAAKTSVYLNRHLVLNSSSARGLALLRASHALRQLELALLRTLEGRLTGMLLLSALIWLLEISALALFIEHLAPSGNSFAAMFANGLLANLGAAQAAAAVHQYQPLVLAALALLSLATLTLARGLHHRKP